MVNISIVSFKMFAINYDLILNYITNYLYVLMSFVVVLFLFNYVKG